MELLEATIRQFRSIKELTISFEEDCQVLLGINEAGKSNILRALGLLSRTSRSSPDDVRQVPHDEPGVNEAEVLFTFRATESDYAAFEAAFNARTRGLGGDLRFRGDDGPLGFTEFAKKYAQTVSYRVNVPSNERVVEGLPGKPGELVLETEWVTPSGVAPVAQKVTVPGHGPSSLAAVPFLPGELASRELPADYVRPVSGADVQSYFWGLILESARQRVPECISWSFVKDSVLPASTNLEGFLKEPQSNPALRNMFALGGYEDVAAAFREARPRLNGVRTLLSRVSNKASKALKEQWTDKAISLEVSENGADLVCVVQDVHGSFDFERRSDGFRRFASFMLMVSARARAGTLDGALLLYDEPDASLHPAAARQLKTELLGLAKRCKVAYATHSQFMVDPENVGRHLLVKRVNEETLVERARPRNVRDEEVLYQAIGHTVFADLAEMNVVVEGYRDRRLIEVALSAANAPACAESLRRVGRCHTRGVKNVSSVVAMLDLINRRYLIVTDGDAAAIERQRAYTGPGRWMTYAELVGDEKVVTAEDFVRAEKVNKVLESLAVDAPELGEGATVKEDRPIMAQIEHALGFARLDKARRGELLNAVKEEIYRELGPDDLRPSASLLVERLGAAIAQVEASWPRPG